MLLHFDGELVQILYVLELTLLVLCNFLCMGGNKVTTFRRPKRHEPENTLVKYELVKYSLHFWGDKWSYTIQSFTN